MFSCLSLIQELEAELERAGIAGCSGDSAESRGAECSSRLPLVRMIQDVKKLTSELGGKSFANAEDLRHGQIHILIGGADERVAAGISQSKGRRSNKGARVEIACLRAV